MNVKDRRNIIAKTDPVVVNPVILTKNADIPAG